jgi:hypothetical protein
MAAQKHLPGALAPRPKNRIAQYSMHPIALNVRPLPCTHCGWKEGHLMKTKLLAVMLLAGGSMFAQTRFSVGVGFGGEGAGFNQPPPSYAYDIPPSPGPDYFWVDGYWSQDYGQNTWIAGYWNRQPFSGGYQVVPRFDNRFNDRDDQRGFTRGFEAGRTSGFNQGRNAGSRDRNQSRGFNQGQSRDSGRNQNQNQNYGNSNRTGGKTSGGQGNRPGNVSTNGFRGR